MTTAAPEFTRSLCASLTLSERRSALRQRHTNGSARQMDDARARDVLRRWKSQPPFTTGDNFEKRLNTAGLTEEELLTILGLPATEYSEFLQIPPQWLQDLDRLYATYGPAEGDPQSSQWAQQATNGFLIIAEPLIEEALRRFRTALATVPAADLLSDADDIEKLASANLFSTLKRVLEKVMVLELNIARIRAQLAGETSGDRFRSFCERLRDREVRLSMAQDYPVLFRSLYARAMNWVDYTIELLSR